MPPVIRPGALLRSRTPAVPLELSNWLLNFYKFVV